MWVAPLGDQCGSLREVAGRSPRPGGGRKEWLSSLYVHRRQRGAAIIGRVALRRERCDRPRRSWVRGESGSPPVSPSTARTTALPALSCGSVTSDGGEWQVVDGASFRRDPRGIKASRKEYDRGARLRK